MQYASGTIWLYWYDCGELWERDKCGIYEILLNMYTINFYSVTQCGIYQSMHGCVMVFYRLYTEIVSGIFQMVSPF